MTFDSYAFVLLCSLVRYKRGEAGSPSIPTPIHFNTTQTKRILIVKMKFFTAISTLVLLAVFLAGVHAAPPDSSLPLVSPDDADGV